MKIELIRYYGDDRVTKSTMQVYLGSSATPSLICEAREPRFADFDNDHRFPGWTAFCLPAGEHVCTFRSSSYSPITVAVGPVPRLCKTLIGADSDRVARLQRILIGFADTNEPPELRTLHSHREAIDQFTDLVRKAYVRQEPFVLEVKNQCSLSTSD